MRFMSKYWVSLLVTLGLAMTIAVPPVSAEPIPDTAGANYFYNRETAFILTYAFDDVNGGIFLAVAPDGSYHGAMDGETIWGVPADLFGGNPMMSTDKSLYGHGTCIRYFITEYQRIDYLESVGLPGLADLNAALANVGGPTLGSPEALLTYARSCADFVINNMVIAPDDGVDENNATVDPWNYADPGGGGGAPDRGDVIMTDRLFYWSSVSEDGSTRFADDTLPQIASQPSAPRAESIVPWSMMELSVALGEAGVGGAGIYRAHVIDWWNWRFNDADELPAFNDPAPPAPDDVNACVVSPPPGGAPGTSLNNCIAGGARDLFIPPMGELLGGAFAAQGLQYANDYLAPTGTETAPALMYPRDRAIQDGTYVAGYSRAALFANLEADGVGVAARDQFWDFGNNPARLMTDFTNPASAAPLTNIGTPFTHYNGREILAGTQRALWFYYTYGENPNQTFPPAGTFTEQNSLDGVLSLWDYINDNLWDTTDGQEAWFESTQGLYKPCFSAGTDLPIGDWAAPLVGNKLHGLNDDGSATVNVTNVTDEPFRYLSWSFRGTGVDEVEVVYTVDNGANWEVLPTTPTNANNHQATIPAQPDGTRVYYYARAVDNFQNRTAFPLGAENWNDSGETLSQSIANSQTYLVGEEIAIEVDDEQSVMLEGQEDVTIAKSVFPPVASPGETVDWSITVSNFGTAPANDISITDNVPDDLTIISATTNTGTVSINGQQVTLTIPELPVGGQAVVTITTEIETDVTASLLFNSVNGVSAQLIVVGGLPNTGETPWWHPCRLFGVCGDR